MSQITLPAIRTAYALAASCGHGWATSLRWAGHDAREAVFAQAVETQDLTVLNALHLKQVAANQAEGMQDWAGVPASLSHVSGSGTLGWEVQPDGSAIVTVGKNRSEFSGWDTRKLGRDVVATVTARPGEWTGIYIDDERLTNIIRIACNAVQTSEPQDGMARAARKVAVEEVLAAPIATEEPAEVIRRPVYTEE